MSLFNGYIPLVAIQVQGYQWEGKTMLIFTIVLNQLELGLVDDDEAVQDPANRQYWEEKQFAIDCLWDWWRRYGRRVYPTASAHR